jgi:hypothetical protein
MIKRGEEKGMWLRESAVKFLLKREAKKDEQFQQERLGRLGIGS